LAPLLALRIEVKILFLDFFSKKDCNGKPDPCGNANTVIILFCCSNLNLEVKNKSFEK